MKLVDTTRTVTFEQSSDRKDSVHLIIQGGMFALPMNGVSILI